MKREILVNVGYRETRVSILEDEVLVELLVDRPHEERHVGDIYRGRVSAILPGMQAAFVDIGMEKGGFLHASDVGEFYEDREDEEEFSRRTSARRPMPIQHQLKKGQEILVQIVKEAIGTKGPRLTTQISLPGRFLVYMPSVSHIGISRRIDDRAERARLRKLIAELDLKEGGVIVRTAGEELSKQTFSRELNSLVRLWGEIKRKAATVNAPALIHEEERLLSGLIRDVFTSEVPTLVIDSRKEYQEIVNYLKEVSPELVDRVRLYQDTIPLFDAYGIEAEIERVLQRKVPLKSGGYIVIELTEALVSIDVNTGSYTGAKDPEETVLRTNLDAAREIARQIRMRDIGGIIVCDFIDMEDKAHQQKVLTELRTWLARDRARTRAFEVTELGIIEMTRQRVRPSLFQTLSELCPLCEGSGRVLSKETMARKIERALKRIGVGGHGREVMVKVHPALALYLLEEEREVLNRLEREHRLDVEVRDDPLLKVNEIQIFSLPVMQDLAPQFVT